MKTLRGDLGTTLLQSLLRCTATSVYIGLAISSLLMVVVFFSTPAQAEISEIELGERVRALSDIESGQLVFKSADDHYVLSPRVNTDVDIQITGLLARIKVSQTFSNPTAQWQEGIYVFPLPETAAVDHLTMRVGERIIVGEIKEKVAARKEYQQAKSAGKQTSLVEQQRPNMFTSSVANIAPHDDITIVIEYQQRVNQKQGEFNLRYPLAITPRYIPGKALSPSAEIRHFDGHGWAVNTDQVEDASQLTPPLTPSSSNKTSISITLAAGFNLQEVTSLYHQVSLLEIDDTTREIELVSDDASARDFVLAWQAKDLQSPQAALFKQRKNGQDYALLMLTPPKTLEKETMSRELVFIVDTSGSMDGGSMEQAKKALQYGLTQLRPQDSFNIIRFSHDVGSVFSDARRATRTNIDIAHDYIDWLRADGGTEMAPALKMALQNKAEKSELRQIVFLTDGSVGNEDALFSIIENNLGNSRLFTVGIGSAPNSHFMRRAARFGRGSHHYIGSTDEVSHKMKSLFNTLSSPVLTDIKLKMDGRYELDSRTQRVADLYIGEPLLLTLKAESLADEIIISGRFGSETWQQTMSLKSGAESQAVSVLWARRSIETLMDEYRRETDNEAIKQDIIDVALAHHLVSKFTSLLAVDKTPVRPQEDPLNSQVIALNPPANSVMNQFPQTATSARLQLLIGLFLLLSALVLRWKQG